MFFAQMAMFYNPNSNYTKKIRKGDSEAWRALPAAVFERRHGPQPDFAVRIYREQVRIPFPRFLEQHRVLQYHAECRRGTEPGAVCRPAGGGGGFQGGPA